MSSALIRLWWNFDTMHQLHHAICAFRYFSPVDTATSYFLLKGQALYQILIARFIVTFVRQVDFITIESSHLILYSSDFRLAIKSKPTI